MKSIKGFFHLSLFVNDVNASLDYYKKLGFEEMFGICEHKGEEPWDIYLRIAQGQYLELQPVHAPNPHPHPHHVTYRNDQTIWHFSLETESMVDLFRNLNAAGIKIWRDPEMSQQLFAPEEAMLGDDGCLIVWLVDPDGNPIEVMQQVGLTKQRKFDHP